MTEKWIAVKFIVEDKPMVDIELLSDKANELWKLVEEFVEKQFS